MKKSSLWLIAALPIKRKRWTVFYSTPEKLWIKRTVTIYSSKVARVLHEDLPELPLVYVPRFFTYNDKVKGFTTDGDGRFNGISFGLSRVWVDR